VKGFTLIELMVTVVVILVLSGGSISAFLKFNKTQTIGSDARQLASEINRVRSLAVSLQYPAGCDNLITYRVESVLIGSVLSGVLVTAECSSGDIVSSPTKILNSSEFSSAFNITFTPGTGYLTTGTDAQITIRDVLDTTVTKIVTIGVYGTTSVSDSNQKELWQWI
jgi:prepilin-type N-terminal cleavage/methylation domain-containing protein